MSSATIPSLTVYVPVDHETDIMIIGVTSGINDRYAEKKVISDPSYINSIVNDPGSDSDKVQRLQKYLQTFDNLTKY